VAALEIPHILRRRRISTLVGPSETGIQVSLLT
jgi:hypothetical protein